MVSLAGYGDDLVLFTLSANVFCVAIAGFVEQAIVVKMVTEIVTVPVRRMTSVIVVETVTMANSSSAANETALGGNGTAAASMGVGTHRPLLRAQDGRP